MKALSTVSVKTQITGELTGVFFQEGQDVKKGDLIFTLDKRPFEAEIKRQEANLQHDTAQDQLADQQPRFSTQRLCPTKATSLSRSSWRSCGFRPPGRFRNLACSLSR